ncbi:P-loop containing nucleoside triphosphate hydrolase protein, partial [Dissophora ornata]
MSGSSSPAAGSSSLATSSKALFGPIPLPSDTYARCLEVFGVVPKPEQIEVADILARREDCILRAGYAWGEIDVYFIPLILWPDRITIILSPLKTLAEEQQQKLDRLGISSIAIRWETDITKKLLNELGNGKYRAVFLCPKILITGDRLRQLWFMEPWRSSLLAVVVDEAHCISTWGKDFRKDYEYIGTLRARVRRDVPFLAVSATLPPRILDDVKAGLYCEPDVRVISVGNDRPNIKYAVTRPQRPVNSYRDLSFLLDFKKSIVYFPNNSVTESAARYLRGLLDNSADLSKIAVYHSVKSDELKRVVLEKFRDNKVLLLLTTEALEMGCDINDVVRVVQYGVPSSISTLIQRFGRAARNPTIEGHGLLLAPQTVSSKIDNDLSRYIQAEGCRRRVLNEIFGNEHRDNDRCCDKCNPEKQANAEAYNGTSAKATSKQA